MDALQPIFPLNKQPGKADPILETQLTSLLSSDSSTDVNLSTVIPELVKSLGGFSESTPANANFSSLVFWIRLNLAAAEIRKGFTGDLGGIGTPGANVSFGTLYYNSKSDLLGSCAVNVNATAVAVNANFIRDGNTFATFIGGGIGTVVGVFGGNGSWYDT